MNVLKNMILLGVGFGLGYLAKKNELGKIVCNKLKRCCLRKVANNIEDAMKKDKKEEKNKEDKEYEEFMKNYKKEVKDQYHSIIKDNDYKDVDKAMDSVIMQEEIDDNIEYMSLEDYEDSRRSISGISQCYYQDGLLCDPNITIFNYWYIRKEKPNDILIVNEAEEQMFEVEFETRILSLFEAFGSSYIKELNRDLSKQENTLVISNEYFGFVAVLRDWTDEWRDDYDE